MQIAEKEHSDWYQPRNHYRRYKSQKAVLWLVIVAQVASLFVGVYFYNTWYELTKYGASAVVSSLLCGFSQGLLQLTIHHHFDPGSLLKFYCWGIINGFWSKWWTEQLFASVQGTALRIICDQAVGNPTSILIFLSFSVFWDGHDADKYFRQIYLKTLKTSYIIWPIASTIQFYLLDPKYLVPFSSIVNVFWTFILGIIGG